LTDEGGILTNVEGFIENNGLFIAKAAFTGDVKFSNNSGGEYRIDYANATLPTINPKSGSKISINANASATLPNNFTLNTGVILEIKTGGTLTHGSGTFTIQNVVNFVNNGIFNLNARMAFTGTINNTATFNLNSGLLELSNGRGINNTGTFVNNAQIFRNFGTFTNNGIYKGSGAFIGFFINGASGTMVPGNSAGCQSFGNGITNNGTVQIEIGGTTVCSEHDRIGVAETAFLGGTLQISLINGFTPTAGQTFTIILAEQINGTFSSVQFPQGINGTISYLSSEVKVVFNTVLPVELQDFKGKNTSRGNLLTWKTAEERQVQDFEIERSSNGENFIPLSILSAKGSYSTYDFMDENPLSGINYYRLKINDLDKKIAYSKIVGITDATENQMKIYPNPASDFITIENVKTGVIDIVNVSGQLVQRLRSENAQGTKLEVDVSMFLNGIYFVKSDNQVLRFVKE
jgi:Secretion system C-terminal sorting domain